jgi:N-acetylneuraminic acid mutarotase
MRTFVCKVIQRINKNGPIFEKETLTTEVNGSQIFNDNLFYDPTESTEGSLDKTTIKQVLSAPKNLANKWKTAIKTGQKCPTKIFDRIFSIFRKCEKHFQQSSNRANQNYFNFIHSTTTLIFQNNKPASI